MPVSKEDDFYRNDAFSLFDIYGHALAQDPCPGGHEIYNFGRPLLGHHYYILSVSNLFMGVEKNICREICIFTI